jgi:hypothetical protein
MTKLSYRSICIVSLFKKKSEIHLCENSLRSLTCWNVKMPYVYVEPVTYSFRNARNREDAAQRLERFLHWKYPLRKPFIVDLPW